MRGIRNALVVVLLAVIAGLIVELFKDPVIAWWRPDGLRAEFVAGPWAPLPESGKLSNGAVEKALMDEDSTFARLTISNPGSAVITNVRILLDRSRYVVPDVYVPAIGNQPARFIEDAREIELPPFVPGQRVTLFMWDSTGLGYPFYLEKWESFSSAGRIDFDAWFPPEDGNTYSDPPDGWVEWGLHNLSTMLIVLLVVAAALLAIGYGSTWAYIKRLLKEDIFYLEENERFQREGDAFQPRL